jgi:hypothetical protein
VTEILFKLLHISSSAVVLGCWWRGAQLYLQARCRTIHSAQLSPLRRQQTHWQIRLGEVMLVQTHSAVSVVMLLRTRLVVLLWAAVLATF